MLAVIGSISFPVGALLDDLCEFDVPTRRGPVHVFQGTTGERDVFYLPRAQGRMGRRPRDIDYVANALALQELGVTLAIGTAVVGSMRDHMPVGSVVICDQIVDFTRNCPSIYDDVDGYALLDMTEPYSSVMRDALIAAAPDGMKVAGTGCYAGVDWARFETAGEIRMFANLGADVIGMTGVAEAVTMREVGVHYATLAIVSNFAAGIEGAEMRPSQHRVVVTEETPALVGMLRGALNGVVITTTAIDLSEANQHAETSAMTAGAEDASNLSCVVIWSESLNADTLSAVLSDAHAAGLEVRAAKQLTVSHRDVADFYRREGVEQWLAGIVRERGCSDAFAIVVRGNEDACDVVNVLTASWRERFGIDRRRNGVHSSEHAGDAAREIWVLFGDVNVAQLNAGSPTAN